ncbi:hypothetical protein LE181_30375, partial [Streptomyces sp. SCA3-4]|nr:hypothetical protein [Streptomyces sichuanensis]
APQSVPAGGTVPQPMPGAPSAGAASGAGQHPAGASAPAGATVPQSTPVASPAQGGPSAGGASGAGRHPAGASASAGATAPQSVPAGGTVPQPMPGAPSAGAASGADRHPAGASAPAGAIAPQPGSAASAAPAASAHGGAGWQAAAGAFGPTGSVTAQQPVLPASGAAGGGTSARAGSRVLVWVAVGLAAFLVGGVGTAGVMFVQQRDGKEDAKNTAPSASPQAPQQGPAPSGAPSGSPAPSASASASASASRIGPPGGELPKGYQRMTSPEGFSLALPEYWQRENRGNNQIDYHGPTGPGQIRIGIGPSGGKSSYDHFREMEKQVSAQDEYRKLQMTANTFLGRPGALWEWTWKDKNGEVMHALNQAYVDESGKEYAIMFSERERLYPEARKIFDTALQFWWVGPYDWS